MTKFALTVALLNGGAINYRDSFGNVHHFASVQGVEVESGCRRSFNVWGYDADGRRLCMCMTTID